ncbi:hypothetical protein GEMRC1_003891 [Eukaryota sp. GEM-RC1]
MESLLSSSPPLPTPSGPESDIEVPNDILLLLSDLLHEDRRGHALEMLSRKRESFSSFAEALWSSVGVVTVLLHEIISTYHLLVPPTLNSAQSTRVNHALGLLQVIASHSHTKMLLLEANIHLYLFPFLATQTQTKPFEYLRLSSLAVIGALLKQDLTVVVPTLLKTEVVPLCLRIMDTCQITARTVATFTIHRIISDDVGLKYITSSNDRFASLHKVLRQNAKILITKRDVRGSKYDESEFQLMRLLLRCWSKLAENVEVCSFLRDNQLPPELVSGEVVTLFRNDRSVSKYQQILVELLGPTK